jgi:undecaprenyl-diphosphatase
MKNNNKRQIVKKTKMLTHTHNTISPRRIIYVFIIGVLLTALAFLIDNSIARVVLGMQNGGGIRVATFITSIGETSTFAAIVLLMTVLFFVYRKPVISLWASVIGAFLVGIILKTVIHRPRPFEAMNLISIVPTSLSSFPSGHAIAVFSLLPYLSQYFPRHKVYFWIIAILVALSRIYLGVHYLSDVIAGAFIGYCMGMVALYFGDKHGWN